MASSPSSMSGGKRAGSPVRAYLASPAALVKRLVKARIAEFRAKGKP